MATDSDGMEQIAGQVHTALESADLSGYRELLDPNVVWAAPDDDVWGCRNRDQVIVWYRRGRAKGMRANVTETLVKGDKILVGLSVLNTESPSESEDPVLRWQILTVKNGLVVDIRGFEERVDAAARMH